MRTSVIIPNYNYADYVSIAIESLLAQTDRPDEIIVVDDGSTDHSRDVLQSFGDQIIAVYQENAGQAAALSRGFARATGDIILFLDSDDVFFPDKIKCMKEIYEAHMDAGWVFHALKHLTPDEARMTVSYPRYMKMAQLQTIDQRSSMQEGVLRYDAPATSGLTFRKECLAPIFPLPTAESISVSDHYIKFFALATCQGLHVNTELGGQIIHGANLYTGAEGKARVTRGKIFVNTAFYLKQKVPSIARLCHDMMIEGRICLGRAAISSDLQSRIISYWSSVTFRERIYLDLKFFIKKCLAR